MLKETAKNNDTVDSTYDFTIHGELHANGNRWEPDTSLPNVERFKRGEPLSASDRDEEDPDSISVTVGPDEPNQ